MLYRHTCKYSKTGNNLQNCYYFCYIYLDSFPGFPSFWYCDLHSFPEGRTKSTTSGVNDVIAITSPQKNHMKNGGFCTEELRDAKSLD